MGMRLAVTSAEGESRSFRRRDVDGIARAGEIAFSFFFLPPLSEFISTASAESPPRGGESGKHDDFPSSFSRSLLYFLLTRSELPLPISSHPHAGS